MNDLVRVETSFNPEQAIRAYLNLRAMKGQLEDQAKEIETNMEQIAEALLQVSDEMGLSTLTAAGVGRATRRETTRFYSTDMPEFRRWAAAHCAEGAVELFEARLAQNAVKSWIETNPHLIPPGLESTTKTTMVISTVK